MNSNVWFRASEGKKVFIVTGASGDIGKAICEEFLRNDCGVIGIDVRECDKLMCQNFGYVHVQSDIRHIHNMPVAGLTGLVNCAGVQNSEDDIGVNLTATVKFTESILHCCMPISEGFESVINVCSTSAHNGAEFAEYAASKGGLLAYTKHLAQRLAPRSVRVNSISPGGVYSKINEPVQNDPDKMKACLEETLLKKWAYPSDIAKWVVFLALEDKNMTGQDIIIDNGELSNFNFIW